MVKRVGSMCSKDEEMKSIPVCEVFSGVVIDIARPLLETKLGNTYMLVAIDHYSKWCEAKVVANHGAKTTTKFLEDDVIFKYGVPSLCLLIMEGNGQQNLMLCVRVTVSNINTQHPSGPSAMGWQSV